MKFIFTFLIVFFSLFASAQNDTNRYSKSYDYGWSYKRLQARDAFILPSDTINNKLGVAVLGNFIYVGNGTKWTLTSGGASSTSIDSLRRSKDSIYARKNGQFIFQYKDSIGSGGGDTAKSYATTIKLTDTSYRLIRTNNTSDTFLFTSALVFDSTSLSNRINGKINISDSAAMLSKYLRKIDTITLSNRINGKVSISDTLSMLSPYIRKVDTLTFSNRINSKINISDSAAMLAPYTRKYISAYSFNANNTNVAANVTEQKFRDSTQKAYTGTITWTGTTAPSGTTNHTYQWSQIGKLVFLRINLDYSVAGAALTQLIMTFPSDCPAPLIPTNVGATNVIVYCSGALTTLKTIAAATSQSPGFSALRINAANNGYELILTRNSQAYQYAYITLQYFAQ